MKKQLKMWSIKKAIPLITVLLFFTSNFFSQDNKVKWGELESGGKGLAYKILPLGGASFYTVRVNGQMILNYSLTRHDNFEMVVSEKVVTRVNGRSAKFEDAHLINKKLVVFLSDIKDGVNHFYFQEYGTDLKPKGDAIELASYKIEDNRVKSKFRVINSSDNSFFAIVWSIPGITKEDNRAFGYKVYGENLEEASTGKYDLPADEKLIGLDKHYLSNTGDYFIAISEFKPSEKKTIFRNYLDYKAFHLIHITPKGAKQYTIDTGGKRIESLNLSSDNNRIFSLIGGYGTKDKNGMSGMFSMVFDIEKEKIVTQNYEPFTANLFNKDADAVEFQLTNYDMQPTELLPDGRTLGSMEKFYIMTKSVTDSKGNVKTMTYYHYDGIITFCMSASGEFEWMNHINKSQVTTDGGVPSSYCNFRDGDDFIFIYNDNIDNYNEKGEFELENNKLETARFTKKKNVVAIVRININTGVMERKAFFDRSESEAIVIPRNFNVDYNNNEVLIYSIKGSKERFGLMSLEGNH